MVVFYAESDEYSHCIRLRHHTFYIQMKLFHSNPSIKTYYWHCIYAYCSASMIRDLLKCFRKIAHGKGFRFKIKLSISEIECSLDFQKQTARSIYKIDWMTVRKCVPISREYSPKQTNKTHSQIDNSPSIYVYIDISNIYNKFSCAS